VKYDFEHVFLKPPVLWHVGKMCSAANVIYSNSHLQMCVYRVSVGKVRIISASTSALYHFEHPHIRTSAFYPWPSETGRCVAGESRRNRIFFIIY